MIRRSGEGVGVEEYFNNGEGDERVFRILQWNAAVQGKLPSTVRYDSINIKLQ